MKIATWNINSIRVRIEQLLRFIKEHNIDVILLQEIKCRNEDFPEYIFDELGYNCSIFGQKTYNGVAILSKYIIDDVKFGTEIFVGDAQARYIEALINGYNLASIYVPNGQFPESPAYQYKLSFLETLINYLKQSMTNSKYILAGDFNITMTDDDVYDPKLWKDKICCTIKERNKLKDIINLGYKDVIRSLQPDEQIYTWWDYRRDALLKNRGLRLDYFFINPDINVKNGYIAKQIREQPRPSDHAPVVIEV
jgi:exodeoxyribonuclease-3